jgi:hypothetical protein
MMRIAGAEVCYVPADSAGRRLSAVPAGAVWRPGASSREDELSSVSTPRTVLSGRRATALILAIIGILGIVLGLLYLFAAKSLPNFVVGHVHHGHHVVRATVSIVIGLALIAAGWLASRTRSSAPAA